MNSELLIRDSGVAITDVLKMISHGYRYEQIQDKYPKLSLADIMAVASFCLEIIALLIPAEGKIIINSEIEIVVRNNRIQTLAEIRERHPRAYRPWSKDEEQQLLALFNAGLPFNNIAKKHQRNVGAIISRLRKLDRIT